MLVHGKLAIEEKISVARTKLILDRPFLGALVLRLTLQKADASWCTTTGTDAKKFYFNAHYIEELKPAELQFVLSHEALHCALSHFARRQHRIKHRWDLACDYAINPILLDEGLTPPPGVMIMTEYRGMTAEEIYPLLKDNDQSETMDQHLYDKPDDPKEGGQNKQNNPLDEQNAKSKQGEDSGDSDQTEPAKTNNGDQAQSPEKQEPEPASSKDNLNNQPDDQGSQSLPPPTLSPQEMESLTEKWQQRVAGAAQQAKQSGKMSALLSRFIDAELAPKLSWRALLATHLRASARDDYSYSRPNNRRGDPAILPMLKSAQVNAVIAVDISGSISDLELGECISEINAIKGQLRACITVLAVDDTIAPGFPKTFEAWEEISFDAPFKGGGGTDFTPVFNWTNAQDVACDVLVYFTDAQGKFPAQAPSYPVIWLVKGKSSVPWGERIQLN